MGCLWSIVKLIFIGLLSIIFLGFIIGLLSDGSSSPEISNQMYDDSQELLQVINEEFLDSSLSANLDEIAVNNVLDSIEVYGFSYKNKKLLPDEEQLHHDIGLIVRDYFLLVSVDASYGGETLDFNEQFYNYSGTKRDNYEGFYSHRKSLREKYGFTYEH